jgi:hypothetical protein
MNANKEALTYRNMIHFVGDLFAASPKEIVEHFGCTEGEANEAAGKCGLCLTTAKERNDRGGDDYWQCWGDFQDDREGAIAEHGKCADDLDALIFGGDETETPSEVFPVGEAPHNPTTGGFYSGGNIERLCSYGYASLAFAGFNQWADSGRMVNKGEDSCKIVKAGTRKDKKTGKEKGFCKKISIFAMEQTHVMTEEEKAAWKITKAAKAARWEAKKAAKKAA